LRSCVGRVAKFDKTYAKAANMARKKLMQEFKAGRRFEFEIADNNDNCDRIVVDVFLDLVVPVDNNAASSTCTDAHSTIRSQLKDALNGLSASQPIVN